MKTKLLIIIAIVMLLIIPIVPNSYACSCGGYGSIEEKVKQTDIIFSGKVLERIEDVKKKTFIFEIDKLWKNNSDIILLEQKNITIFTALDESACGTDFIVGLDYLVYVYTQGKTAHTSLCSGSDLLFLKNTELQYLASNIGDKYNEPILSELEIKAIEEYCRTGIIGEHMTVIPQCINEPEPDVYVMDIIDKCGCEGGVGVKCDEKCPAQLVAELIQVAIIISIVGIIIVLVIFWRKRK